MARTRTPRSLGDIYFDEHQQPDLLATAEHLDQLDSDDSVERAAAAVLARRRVQLVELGIQVDSPKCPCFLRDAKGRLHRRRQGGKHLIDRCYALGDHPRGWYRGRDLAALTYEPYNGHSSAWAGELLQEIAPDDLVASVWACCAVHFPPCPPR